MNLWDVVRIPFDAVRYGFRQLRKALFTAPRPSGRYLVVDVPVEEVEAHLGRRSFAPNWEFSYYERGEDLNVARVVYDPTEVGGETRLWWQTHVRGWENGRGEVELHGHWELEPTENANDHIDGVGFSFERGMEKLAETLDDASVEYESRTVTVDR